MSAVKKNSVEVYNIDDALAVFGNNQFQFIIAAAQRAREIESARLIASKNGQVDNYQNRATVTAITEFATGKVGVEYLDKVGKGNKE